MEEKKVNLVKKETITLGPPVRCARHDITLPGDIKTNVKTLGKCSNHHIWLRFRSDWCQDTSDSGNELWEWVPKWEFIIKLRRGWGGGWWTQRQLIEISKKMDFHNYVNKEITLARLNDLMMYARGKHTYLNIGWKLHPKYGLASTINVRMVIR